MEEQKSDLLKRVEDAIKRLEEENRNREKDIVLHGQMKEQLIGQFMEAQGAIKHLKEVIEGNDQKQIPEKEDFIR